MHSNVDVLTHAHTVLKAKARKKKNQIDHIAFDEQARHEYLTGFRKRNLLKKEAAKNKAKERERQERLQARREQRQALQEQAKLNASLTEKAYRKAVNGGSDSDNDSDQDEGDASEEEFTGFSSAQKGKGKQTQDAFEDDEQLATVTIVEEFDPHSLRHGPSLARDPPSHTDTGEPASPAELSRSVSAGPRIPPSRPSSTRRPKSKSTEDVEGDPERKRSSAGSAKKVAYETKAARKAERQKQRTRKLEKAARAGKKAGHREGAKGRRKGKH